jgi:hypothetical protein
MRDTDEFFDLEPEDKQAAGPVQCIGMTFENDETSREYFLNKLRVKLLRKPGKYIFG